MDELTKRLPPAALTRLMVDLLKRAVEGEHITDSEVEACGAAVAALSPEQRARHEHQLDRARHLLTQTAILPLVTLAAGQLAQARLSELATLVVARTTIDSFRKLVQVRARAARSTGDEALAAEYEQTDAVFAQLEDFLNQRWAALSGEIKAVAQDDELGELRKEAAELAKELGIAVLPLAAEGPMELHAGMRTELAAALALACGSSGGPSG